MDPDQLTQAFLSWLETHDSSYSFSLMYESASNSRLRFQIDHHLVTLDFDNCTVTPSNKLSFVQTWGKWSQTYLSDRIGDLLTSELTLDKFFDKIIEKYETMREEAEFEDSDSDEEDYKAIIETEDVDRGIAHIPESVVVLPSSRVKVIGDLSDVATNHFVFRHAEEAKTLVDSWLKHVPELAYSLNINTFPSIALIKLELDLSFVDLSDESMDMLGFTFDDLLSVNISLRRGTLIETAEFGNWTPRLFKDLDIECLQGTKMDSFGCKEYVPGLVRSYLNYMYKRLLAMEDNQPFFQVPAAEEADFSGVRVDDRLVSQLVDMGYARSDSIRALKNSANNIELAVEELLSSVPKPSKPTFQVSSQPDWLQEESANTFYNLLFSLRNSLQNCTKQCVFCYKKHSTDSYRLRACSNEMCEFRFEEIAGFSVYAELRNNMNSVMVDLSIASISAQSNRALNVFEPFPSFLLLKRQIRGRAGFLDREQYRYTPEMDQNKDVERLRHLIRQIPSLFWLLETSSNEKSLAENIVTSCHSDGRDVYKLLRYIIATNRLSLLKLQGADKIAALAPEIEQYIVTSHSPDALQEFTSEKAKFGSFFAFHGSSIENWYSIIRNGLRNMSNSHMMTAGAAYGSGVYAAEHFGTSLGYCGYNLTSSCWEHCMLKSHKVMAIIEVINKKEYSHGGIYVIPYDRHIIIRYLLVFDNAYGGVANSIAELKLEQHISEFEARFAAEREEKKTLRVQQAIAKAKAREALNIIAEAYFKKQQEENKELELKKTKAAEPNPVSPEVQTKLQAIESSLAGTGSVSANKRLINEYKYLITSKDCVGLKVSFANEDNLYIWLVQVDITQFETPPDLKRDFQLYSERTKRPMTLDFEVRFSANFPFSPPFLRVIRPRFAFHTGHVTVGGSICMQSLTPSGWIPVRTVESVFIEILFNMGEGGARLDLGQLGTDYSFEEAQEAFMRVAKQHNWL